MQAQNDFAHAIGEVGAYGAPERMVEAAIAERHKRHEAIVALLEAVEWEQRGF